MLLLLLSGSTYGQFDQSGIPFRGLWADQNGVFQVLDDLDVRTTVYVTGSPSQRLWQETQSLTTDSFGLFSFVIGNGQVTGNSQYADFDLVPFGDETTSILVEVDADQSGLFLPYFDQRLWAVPYAYHALSSGDVRGLSEMTDVDSMGVDTLYGLTWTGTEWETFDAEGAVIVAYADSSGQVTTSDTANYAQTSLSINDDTAAHAFWADSALYTDKVAYVPVVDSSIYADTAAYAYDGHFWKLLGNANASASHALGTNNAQPLRFFVANQERARLDTGGRFHVNGTDSLQDLFVNAQAGGFVVRGPVDSGFYYDPAPGRYFYYALNKGSLRFGDVVDTLWDRTNVGKYSVAGGRHSWARNNYALALGDSSRVYNIAANANLSTAISGIAMGKMCETNGQYSIAGGFQSEAKVARSVAMGYRCIADDGYSSVAMGYNAVVDGDIVSGYAIGYNVQALGRYTLALGNNVSTGYSNGTFIFGDASTSTMMVADSSGGHDHQFISRAAGGYYFYSDAAASMGVILAPGSGTWASISDRRKKEGFVALNDEVMFDRIMRSPVYTWNYITQDPNIHHVGPMAQAFYRQHGLGEDVTRISTVDMDGVIMAGILALDRRIAQLPLHRAEALHLESQETNEQYEALDARVDQMEERLQKLLQHNANE